MRPPIGLSLGASFPSILQFFFLLLIQFLGSMPACVPLQAPGNKWKGVGSSRTMTEWREKRFISEEESRQTACRPI
jgi:hypothetical protein